MLVFLLYVQLFMVYVSVLLFLISIVWCIILQLMEVFNGPHST